MSVVSWTIDDVTNRRRDRRAKWLLAHPIAGASVVGEAFGVLFGAAFAGIAAVMTEKHVPMGFVVGAIVVGALIGPAFGFPFMKAMRPVFEAQLSGPANNRELLGTVWRRDHDRLRSHPWFWFRLPLLAFTVGFANAIYDMVNAESLRAAIVNSVLVLAAVLLSAYWLALWHSPSPPWQRQ